MFRVPTFQQASADFIQRIELGGQIVQLQITWNSREACFYMTLTDPLGATLSGIKLVSEWPLLTQFQGVLQFDGEFLILRTSVDALGYITYDNLGNGWDLIYVNAEELQTWKLTNGL